MRACFIVGVLGIVVSLPSPAAAEPGPACIDRFEKKVRPLLAARCWQCHGPEKRKGGLRLDTAMAVDAGGDSGPVVVPGKPEREPVDQGDRLFGRAQDAAQRKAQRRRDRRAHRVGPRGPSGLAPARRGRRQRPGLAGGPLFTAEQKAFWAFQPPRDPVPPRVKATGWPTSPSDRFILDRAREKGTDAGPADRQADIDTTRHLRPDRAATHSRGGRLFPF